MLTQSSVPTSDLKYFPRKNIKLSDALENHMLLAIFESIRVASPIPPAAHIPRSLPASRASPNCRPGAPPWKKRKLVDPAEPP